MLNCPYIQILNPYTWIALATITACNIDKLNNKLKHDLQKKATRSLLAQLLQYLKIQDELDERQFPYRLKKTGYYVCFSHSNHCVGVIVGKKKVAVDIEMNTVPWQVAQRFFHQNEIKQLAQITKQKEQLLLCQWLWQLKECMIKIYQSTLVVGLKEDFSDCITGFRLCFKNVYLTHTFFFLYQKHYYQVRLYPFYNGLIVYEIL